MKFCCGIASYIMLTHIFSASLACPEMCTCASPTGTEVICSDVPLTAFPSGGLPGITTILTVQLTNITSVSEEDMSAVPLLQELHLNENQLQNLSSHFLRGLPRLHHLDLTGNQLSLLPAGVFGHAPLRSLVLKNNRIERVAAEWLPENSSVTWLDLSENRLTEVPTALLQKLPALENLDLSGNQLETLSAASLEGLTKLQRLSLQDNKLRSVDASAFKSARGLTAVFLTRNKLKELPRNLFDGLARLTHLSLDENELSHIPEGLLDPLISLEKGGLDLTVNPLVCDEEVKYLWRWIQKNKEKVFKPDSVTCSQPEFLRGQPVGS